MSEGQWRGMEDPADVPLYRNSKTEEVDKPCAKPLAMIFNLLVFSVYVGGLIVTATLNAPDPYKIATIFCASIAFVMVLITDN